MSASRTGAGLRPSATARSNGFTMFLLAWFLFMASTSFWLPAHKGTADLGVVEAVITATLYALIAVIAVTGVRLRAETVQAALLSALPNLALIAVAAAAGYLRNRQQAEFRGEPLFLYFGVATWASWAALLTLSALVSRRKWNVVPGLVATLIVALLGLFEFTARID